MENILWFVVMGLQVIGFIWAISVAILSHKEAKRQKEYSKIQGRRMAQVIEMYNMSLAREDELLKELEKKDKHV